MKSTVYIACLTLLLIACQPPEPLMDHDTRTKSKAYRQTEVEAMFRRNPNPVRRYEIMMTIKNSPGVFQWVKGYAQYEASECIYLMNPAEGVHSHPMTTIDIPFVKIDDYRYSAVIYDDEMLDEDYFGSGVCKWRFTFARAELRATGADDETTFVMPFSSKSINFSEVNSSSVATSYFWKGSYPKEDGGAYSEFGFPKPDAYKPNLREQLFTISLDIEVAEP